MSFATKSSKSTNKNLFVARQVSKKTGKTASWLNLTEEFARTVFGCELKLVTAEQAMEKLPTIYETAFLEVAVTDLTLSIEVVSPEDY